MVHFPLCRQGVRDLKRLFFERKPLNRRLELPTFGINAGMQASGTGEKYRSEKELQKVCEGFDYLSGDCRVCALV
jgi:hypothetical protein